MENRRRVTEEDLLITEAMIGKSYGQLKQSVIRAPSRAYRTISQTAREHPYATAATAVVAGVVVYKIINKLITPAPTRRSPGREEVPQQNERCRPDPMHDMMLMILPMVTPYIASYVQKYLEKVQVPSGKRD